jgi:exportin-5
LDYFLSLNIVDDPSFPQYSDSVKNLHFTNTLELQRLAIAFANDFAPFYEELESKIAQNLDSLSPNLQTHLGYRAFLFIIVHRAQDLDSNIRLERLRTLIMPVKEAWEGSEVSEMASDFGKFCKYLGLDHLPEYLTSRGFDRVQDWSVQELDLEGQQLQADIQRRTENIPIRLTKTLLIASVEKLKSNSVPFEISRQMWAELMPSFLPDLLQIISHAEAFYDLGKWSSLPPEMQQVIRRICTDRFWQAGISTESKDDFFARVSGSKHTYEGFASTVRGSVRQIRESAYQILMYLIKFKDSFYAIKDLPGPLSEALYGNASHLSPHHFSVLLTTSTHIIDGCPIHLRRYFLPTLLSKLFTQIDHKLTNEWSFVYQRTMQAGPGDDLGDEMKTESILRQLTYNSIMLAYTLLDQRRIDDDVEEGEQEQPDRKMYQFILDRADILEPVLILAKNALRFRDTRTVGKAVEIFRSVLPSFREPSTVHTFLCRDVLQDAIISFHEPYFVDSQRDLTGLIAQIIRTDEAQAREVLLSLSPLAQKPEKVEKMLQQVRDHRENDRKVRALVWELLDGIRGQSIQEMGKIQTVFPKKPKVVKTQYVNPLNPDGATNEQKRVSPELAGVADMLG